MFERCAAQRVPGCSFTTGSAAAFGRRSRRVATSPGRFGRRACDDALRPPGFAPGRGRLLWNEANTHELVLHFCAARADQGAESLGLDHCFARVASVTLARRFHQLRGAINIGETGNGRNKPLGDNARKGAVKKRSQLKTGNKSRWTKRSRETGEFMDVKKRETKFKGVRREI